MRVSQIAAGVVHARLFDPGLDPDITDVTNDSRAVGPGSLYAALPGLHHDGHDFIAASIVAGATAILCERLPARREPGVAYLQADNARLAMSELACRFHGDPSSELAVIGVTGTDGKTSTVSFVHQLLGQLGCASAFLSTAAMQVGPVERPNLHHQSTPEAPEVHRILRSMVSAGARYAVLESTSHGLSMRTARLAHVRYRVAVFTNLSHEHLEFHGSYAQYRHDKANLFRALDVGRYADHPDAAAEPEAALPGRPARGVSGTVSGTSGAGSAWNGEPFGDTPFGVMNLDDPEAAYFLSVCHAPILTYAIDARAHFQATEVVLSASGSEFLLQTPSGSHRCRVPVPGSYNVQNVLAACAVAQGLTGTEARVLAQAVRELTPVTGRMQLVMEAPFSVVVDYAHTPGAFTNVLPFFRTSTRGRLVVVFGSAGERDVGKRPIQGRLADQYADIIVLTDEDPRGEDRLEILRQIAVGCAGRSEGPSLALIPDRRTAIAHALGLARPGDTVLLLGKGHEATIIGPEGTVHWDEARVAREELARLGYQWL